MSQQEEHNTFSHIGPGGEVRMVNVSDKPVMRRSATATGLISMNSQTVRMITSSAIPKGNVLETARIAAIQAAKKTGDWIPLCHPLPIQGCDVVLTPDEANACIHISVTTSIEAKTGVEMESLTAVSAAALTIYDMCKAVDKSMAIGDIKLTVKTKQPSQGQNAST